LGRLTLVLGGARSGKSAFAEGLATEAGERVAYLATAEVSDQDMQERIRRHQLRRPPTWQTIEASLDPATAVERAGSGWHAILLDSAGAWLANMLLRRLPENQDPAKEALLAAEAEMLAEIRRMTAVLQGQAAASIVVSDEAGLGIVPAYAIGRVFRDLLGTMNQLFASEASDVFLIVAGLPLRLKGPPGHAQTDRAGAT
jgi:adenosylcobinamide kinase / adenosylcobinamide-phosphate guanylyltransferase